MVKIRTHWDADGICSAYFTSFGVDDSEIEFGDCERDFGDTTGLTKDDWMTDMKPNNTKWKGTVIDHHLPYPDEHDYTLYSDLVPASLIAFRMFKDKIPKSEWWKVAVGLAGDGQPELIPTEVFLECPDLLREVKTSAYQSYGNWKINSFPAYKLLSSGLNSLMRKKEYESALNLLKYADNPFMILNSEDANIAKSDMRQAVERCIKDSEIYNYGNLVIVIYYSKYRLSGYIGSVLESTLNGKTVMAINKRNGSLSLRGDLANYYQDTLRDIENLTIDGHVKYMGGKYKDNYQKLIKELNKRYV
jgi:hypothetical protein